MTCTVELDGQRVAVTGAVAAMIASLVRIAPELPPAGKYKLTLDVGQDGSVRPGLQRSWPEQKAAGANMVR